MKRHFAAVILAIVGCHASMAKAETMIYSFLPDQSEVIVTGGLAGVYETYSVVGQLQLTVDSDAGVASFDYVDATLDGLTPLSTSSLDELFNMSGLNGSVVSETRIDFTGQSTSPMPADILLELTFEDDLIQLTGGFDQNQGGGADGFVVTLDATATMVPEPTSLLLLGSGLVVFLAYRRRGN